jgi:signal transduction histidine kinase
MTGTHKRGWKSLSLTAKGLVFLSIPLCLQLGFGIVLIQLQAEAEAEARRASEARAISTQINSLMSGILQVATLSLTASAPYGSDVYKCYLTPQFGQLLRKIQDGYTRLDNLTANKPELSRIVKQSYKPFSEAVQLVEQARRDIIAGHPEKVVFTREGKSDRFSTLGHYLVSQELELLAKTEEAYANNSNKKQTEIRQLTVRCASIVMLATIVLSLILAKFLVQTMTARLRIMADNAVRLAAHQPLNPQLDGEDEIAELDHFFHGMARTIDESARTKQEFYNMVTHDFRTPLASIQGSLEMLAIEQKEEFGASTKKLIRMAVRNSTRTMGLVSDLLDSQKLEAGMLTLNATPVHLEDVFETVNLAISGWIEEHGLKLTFATTNVVVMANQDLLGRILVNLISNSIKYSPRGSTITVAVKPASNMAEITVCDQGPGIPKHMLKTVFDRFRQASSDAPASHAGSGLGLSICQDFVLLHGGKIWATSDIGHGSAFHFTLPLA